ncbi:MAG: hypothetical protein AAF799_44365 [Myxococcota bacterium]
MRAANTERTRFPFRAYPDGWFAVAKLAELPVRRTLFGRPTLIRWHGQRIEATDLPHLEVRDGLIFAWHHASGEPPSFRIPPVDNTRWSKPVIDTLEVSSHPQEVLENTVDTQHFIKVHGYRDFESLQPAYTEGPHFHASYRFTRALLDHPASPRVPIEIEIQASGLGYSRVEVTVVPVGLRARLEVMVTPLLDERCTLRSATRVQSPALPGPWSSLQWPVDRLFDGVAHLAALGGRADVRDDLRLWQHKIYATRPVLIRDDGPIGSYRRWARQFMREAA